MYGASFRSSDGFIIFVVGAAVFTDMMLYGLIVPMLPYVLVDRVGISPEDIQKWNSILLGVFGGALMFGSCMYFLIFRRLDIRVYVTRHESLCPLFSSHGSAIYRYQC